MCAAAECLISVVPLTSKLKVAPPTLTNSCRVNFLRILEKGLRRSPTGDSGGGDGKDPSARRQNAQTHQPEFFSHPPAVAAGCPAQSFSEAAAGPSSSQACAVVSGLQCAPQPMSLAPFPSRTSVYTDVLGGGAPSTISLDQSMLLVLKDWRRTSI